MNWLNNEVMRGKIGYLLTAETSFEGRDAGIAMMRRVWRSDAEEIVTFEAERFCILNNLPLQSIRTRKLAAVRTGRGGNQTDERGRKDYVHPSFGSCDCGGLTGDYYGMRENMPMLFEGSAGRKICADEAGYEAGQDGNVNMGT